MIFVNFQESYGADANSFQVIILAFSKSRVICEWYMDNNTLIPSFQTSHVVVYFSKSRFFFNYYNIKHVANHIHLHFKNLQSSFPGHQQTYNSAGRRNQKYCTYSVPWEIQLSFSKTCSRCCNQLTF